MSVTARVVIDRAGRAPRSATACCYHGAMDTAIHCAVDQARRGANPRLIARFPSGWAVLGDPQVLRGYCLLLPDPVVPHLNALELPARAAFLRDMTLLGDAVLAATGALRINYEMLGNLEPALHAHVVPRFADEPAEHRAKPVWSYDFSKAPAFEERRDRPLMDAIASKLAAGRNSQSPDLARSSSAHTSSGIPHSRPGS